MAKSMPLLESVCYDERKCKAVDWVPDTLFEDLPVRLVLFSVHCSQLIFSLDGCSTPDSV